MLAAPGFLAGQRFEAVSVSDAARFLALYAVESPAAFQTPYYRAAWGWGEWRPFIGDWSRSLFAGIGDAFLVQGDERLQVAFAGAEVGAAAVARARPDLTWAPAAGLDGTYSAIGIRRVAGAVLAAGEAVGPGSVEGLFRPVSPPRRASA